MAEGGLSKAEFEERADALRVELLDLQAELRERDLGPALVNVGGDDRLGVHRVLNRLSEWLDPREVRFRAYGPPTEEERAHPRLWRYWHALPPRGQVGVFTRAWTARSMTEHLLGDLSRKGFKRALRDVVRFERLLVDEGLLLVKIALHLPRRLQARRVAEAEQDPGEAFLVDERERAILRRYEDVLEVGAETIERTHRPGARWRIVRETDERRRDLLVGELVRDRLRAFLGAGGRAPAEAGAGGAGGVPEHLARLDLSRRLERDEYEERKQAAQARLYAATCAAATRGVPTVLVFEGADAAGKGGAIRRLSAAIDAALRRVHRVAAPSEEERRYPYLWRFWRRVPRDGRVAVFDRSWYGRVLVERVEGLAAEADWRRAYRELVDFERQLARHGALVLKFWLHIDPDEQLARFEERERTPHKRYKITEEDWRNRERWPDYVAAVDEMVERTHRERAPWHLVAANDKRWARVQVLETVADALEARLA